MSGIIFGLKPTRFLEIVFHVLKDVAIAPTFRSGISKKPIEAQGLQPFPNCSNLRVHA
jgi:hypothetical protein